MSKTAFHKTVKIEDGFVLTLHAWERMGGRWFSPEVIRKVLEFGRQKHVRGTSIYGVGRKEICQYEKKGFDHKELDGLQVVCSEEGAIIAAYRNRDFRGLKY
jgi:hypothetical protein